MLNTDYSYCSGVACPLRNNCKRFLPNPPDEPLWWIAPAYKFAIKQCPYFEKINSNESNNN